MELRHFKLLVSIADEGSLTRAADKLCLTQSALSHQLKQLEDSLGYAVFHRRNRKLLPTERGEKLIGNGRKIIADVGRTLKSATDCDDRNTLKLMVECYNSFFWLPEVLADFNLQYPKTEVSVESSLSHDYISDLSSNACHIALVINKKKHDALEFHELVQDRLVVVMSKANALAKHPSLYFESLKSETLITHCRKDEINEIFEHITPPSTFKPYKVIQITTTEGIIDLVSKNMGVAVMSEWAVQRYCTNRDLVIKPFEKDQNKRSWYLATQKKNANPAVEYFVQLMKQKHYS